MAKQVIIRNNIKFSNYFYDPETEKVYGPRKEMSYNDKNKGFAIRTDEGQIKWIPLKWLKENYPTTHPEDLSDSICDFISLNFILTNSSDRISMDELYKMYQRFCHSEIIEPDELDTFQHLLEQTYKIKYEFNDELGVEVIGLQLINTNLINHEHAFDVGNEIVYEKDLVKKSDRSTELKDRMLDDSYHWNTDRTTISKAYKLLDRMDTYEFQLKEREAYDIMKRRKLDEKAIPEIMVQLASAEVLAKEVAYSTEFRKEYINMTAHEVLQIVSPYFNEALEKYLIESWRDQFRERFYQHIMYAQLGVRLRGYSSLHIPLQTIEEIQSAYKLLTELYGWED